MLLQLPSLPNVLLLLHSQQFYYTVWNSFRAGKSLPLLSSASSFYAQLHLLLVTGSWLSMPQPHILWSHLKALLSCATGCLGWRGVRESYVIIRLITTTTLQRETGYFSLREQMIHISGFVK